MFPFLVSSDAPIVILYGSKYSTLHSNLRSNFRSVDIQFKSFTQERQLKRWIRLNPLLTVVSLVIEVRRGADSIISEIHCSSKIRSILVHCDPSDKEHLQVLPRLYYKVDGIFTDERRLLIKLGFDLSFYSEELGDYFKDKKDDDQARRHYDRALSLYALLEQIEQLDDTEVRCSTKDKHNS